MKRKLLILFSVIAVLALMSAGTLAYFTTSDKATNVITAGNLKLEVHETTKDGTEFPSEGVVVMPGDTVSKIVTVENTGAHPMYVRVRLSRSVNDDALTADNCISMNINTKYWTYNDADDYYYYKKQLLAGETTKALFTKVEISGEAVDNAYMGKQFNVNVAAYGVQSENNGKTVMDAQGWPAEQGEE